MADVAISGLPEITPTGTESLPMSEGVTQTGRSAVREVVKLGYQTITLITGIAVTLTLLDRGKWMRFTSSTAVTLTVPTNADVAFAIGETVNGIQSGSGKLTIVGASGVTINKPSTHTLSLRGQHSAFTLIKVADNTWDLVGDLEAVV